MKKPNITESYVLDLVREGKASMRNGADLLGITYREFMQLMAKHKIPIFNAEAEPDWWEHERKAFKFLEELKNHD